MALASPSPVAVVPQTPRFLDQVRQAALNHYHRRTAGGVMLYPP